MSTCFNFFYDALNGDMELFEELYDPEGSITIVRDYGGGTVLHKAAGEGKTHICKYLINKLKFDVHDQDYDGFTALHYAVSNNYIETALYLLDNGASIAKTNNIGFTPLHVAAIKGGKDLLQLLLSRGSDIESKSDDGTPLTVAAFSGNTEAVKFLLQNKANHSPDNSFGSPIIISTRVSLACTELLVKSGADPNYYFCGKTPLHSAVLGHKIEIIMYLLRMGANPNTLNYMDLTPLELAAHHGDMKAIIVLFPVTTKIPSIPDWSIDGLLKYVKSKEYMEKIDLMKKRGFHMAKSKGEEAFKREEYWVALNWYNMANRMDLSDAAVWSNMSMCYARLDRGFSALSDAKKCVSLRPDWAKAHYREGVAWKLLRKYNDAIRSFCLARSIDPNNLEIHMAIGECIESQIASWRRI